jgi:hypothetical protein
LVPKRYNYLCQLLKLKLVDAVSVNISLDIWSDGSMRSFIAFCVHFIDSKWSLITAVLSCVRLDGRHTFDIIYKNFKEAIDDYGIANKVFKIVTDGGSNIVKAFRTFAELHESTLHNAAMDSITDTIECVLMNKSNDDDNDSEDSIDGEEDVDDDDEDEEGIIRSNDPFFYKNLSTKLEYDYSKNSRIGCSAHILQNCIKEGLNLNQADALINKVSDFITKCKKSCPISDELRSIGVFLLKANKTRWNSTFKMLDSFLKLTPGQFTKLLSIGSAADVKANKKKYSLSATEYD